MREATSLTEENPAEDASPEAGDEFARQEPEADAARGPEPDAAPEAEPDASQEPEPDASQQPEADASQQPEADAAPQPEAWAALIADPGRTPEILALAAVRTIGPKARDWAARARDTYPAASDDALARLATQQFGRPDRLGPALGSLTGSYVPPIRLTTTAIVQAELVLHIAAAYGEDPTDPNRAADLLALTEISDKSGKSVRTVVARAATWAALRLANRYFPGTALLAAFLTTEAEIRTTAARAVAHYGRRR
jgi:hypothetical protein